MKKNYLLIFVMSILAVFSCKQEDFVNLEASFESDVTFALIGEDVTFDDVSVGNPTKWDWTFEGGEPATSVLTQPKVKWMKPGVYAVTLKVSNRENVSEITKQGYVTVEHHKTVTADFEFDKTQLFDDEIVTITNTSKGFPTNIKWTFTSKDGKAIEIDDYNVSQQFPVGEYSIKLDVSNPLATDSKEIKDAFKVLDRYAVIAGIGGDNFTTYAGGSIQFRDASTGNAQSWQWEFEGGVPSSSSEQNPVVKYNMPGTYDVKLKTYNDKYDSYDVQKGLVRVLPDNGIVFLLPFDENYNDYGPYKLSPNKYSLGGLDFTWEESRNSGASSKAIRFPGGTKGAKYSVLQMPDKLSEHYGFGSDMTISVWIKISPVGSNNAIFAQGACPGSNNGNSCQIWGRLQSGSNFRVTAEQTTPKIGITATSANGTNFDDENWHHLAVVFAVGPDGKRQLKTYKDGTQIKSASGDNFDVHTIPFFIGSNLRFSNNAWAPENMFNGLMDDFVLYNRGLSDDEIKELSNL